MDNFSIGDKVIYPNQGIGIVEDIQRLILLVIEQIIQTFEIFTGEVAPAAGVVAVPAEDHIQQNGEYRQGKQNPTG